MPHQLEASQVPGSYQNARTTLRPESFYISIEVRARYVLLNPLLIKSWKAHSICHQSTDLNCVLGNDLCHLPLGGVRKSAAYIFTHCAR
jgi:hypothetical protein